MATKKLINKEGEVQLDLVNEQYKKERGKPEYKEKFAALVLQFGEDLDALRHFTTDTQIQLEKVIKENEMLCRHMDVERDHAELFSHNGKNPNITAYTKVGAAKWLEENGLAGPSSRSFMSGLNASKKISAKNSANVRTQKIKALRDFAIKEFLKGEWKSLKAARDALWLKVHAESRLRNTELTEKTGPETLYKWLRAYKKSSVT